MGAASGSSSVIELLGSRVNRFGPKPSEEEAGRQQDIRDKLLARLALPQFIAKTERDLEDWADVAARQVSRYHVCVALFQEAWEAVSPPSVAAIIGQATRNTTHEELVDDVATRLHPCSKYVEECGRNALSRKETIISARCRALDDCEFRAVPEALSPPEERRQYC